MRLAGLTVGFIILLAIFWVLEFYWPGVEGQKRLRRGFRTDVFYWLFTPLVGDAISRVVLLLALVPALLLVGRSIEREALLAGWGPLAEIPAGPQFLLALVIGDFLGYWAHRWFHGRRLWRFHAVHHSSKDLDWLSSVRVHPVNGALGRVLRAVPLVLMGFSPVIVAGYLPFLTFHAILLHANVSWTFGPLRYVLASPVFHRWHHSDEPDALGKNFGGLLPIWDLLFGTYYMPVGQKPQSFGDPDDGVPEAFWRQLAYPFQRAGAE